MARAQKIKRCRPDEHIPDFDRMGALDGNRIRVPCGECGAIFLLHALGDIGALMAMDLAPATLRRVQRHLRAVIAYNWRDELSDYRHQEEGRAGHIFHALVALDNWVEGTRSTPRDYLKEERS